MNMAWAIYYKGMLAGRKVNKGAAQSLAFKLAKEKGWKIEDLVVREMVG